MSVARRTADGLKNNVLAAILDRQDEEGDRTILKAQQSLDSSLSTASFGKRSLHSSRLTLSDSKEFYKTHGIRWIKAVRKGNVCEVKQMLEEKSEMVNYTPLYGPNALHIATARGDRSIILLLVAKGADIDARDTAGYTCLQTAILMRNNSLAHFLISQGANMEMIDPEGLGIWDYDNWSVEDQMAASKSGNIALRPKAHSFAEQSSSSPICRPSASFSHHHQRPSSTPDASVSSTNENNLKRSQPSRNSWKSFFSSDKGSTKL